jgi:hypothetical protein
MALAGDDRDQTTVLLHVMGGPQCKQPLLVADNSFIECMNAHGTWEVGTAALLHLAVVWS